MSALLADLEEQASTLSPNERAHLAEVLLESLHNTPVADIEAAWEHEVATRVAAFDRGGLETYAAEDVFTDARRTLR